METPPAIVYARSCAFCGKIVDLTKVDRVELTVRNADDSIRLLTAHRSCFENALQPYARPMA